MEVSRAFPYPEFFRQNVLMPHFRLACSTDHYFPLLNRPKNTERRTQILIPLLTFSVCHLALILFLTSTYFRRNFFLSRCSSDMAKISHKCTQTVDLFLFPSIPLPTTSIQMQLPLMVSYTVISMLKYKRKIEDPLGFD